MSATALADLERRLQDADRALSMAKKYVWWQSPARTLADGRLLLAQMMTLATADDVRWLLSVASSADLLCVLDDPPVGVFNRRSWAFWHLRLGRETIPDLPVRRLPA